VRSVDEQLKRVLEIAVRPAPVRVAISDAQGLRSAEEVVASRALPGFDQAAIDGYAVRSVDVAGNGDGPPDLPVVGEIPAGSRQPLRLQPGQAVKVSAGAPLPTLADAVLPAGFTEGGSARLRVDRGVPSAAFVRRIGEDVQPGDVAVRRDAVIGAAQIALLAAAGRDKVLVHPRPRLSVVSMGDELVDVSRAASAGHVPDVCSSAIAAAAREAGAEIPRPPRLVRDDARELRSAVEDLLPFSELVVICGAAGGSSGAEAKAAFAGLGEIDATRVAMSPGSSQAFGRLGRDSVPTFLFPSSPATALVLFEVLVRPLIRLGLGITDPHRRTVSARLTSPLSSPEGRRSYLRGRLLREVSTGEYLVQPLATAGTHLLATLAEANAMITVPESTTDVTVDEQVDVALLSARQ
jgi:molybdopterin molybdotransferase